MVSLVVLNRRASGQDPALAQTAGSKFTGSLFGLRPGLPERQCEETGQQGFALLSAGQSARQRQRVRGDRWEA